MYETNRSIFDFIEFMAAGACSKTCATVIAYPHGEFTLYFKGQLFYNTCFSNEVGVFLGKFSMEIFFLKKWVIIMFM